MSFLGLKVKHVKFGDGKIVNVKNGNILEVEMQNGELKTFMYPDSFLKGLSFVDNENINNQVEIDYKNKKEQEQKNNTKPKKKRRHHFITHLSPYETAYHEAGHAIVNEILNPNSVNKAELANYYGYVYRGRVESNIDDDFFIKKNKIQNKIVTLLSGIAAEDILNKKNTELYFNKYATIELSNDIDRASFLLKIIAEMDNLEGQTDEVFLEQMQNYYTKAKDILIKNERLLNELAVTLLSVDNMTIYGNEIREIIKTMKKSA